MRIAGARRVVEIDTANGYSTIWLANAVSDTDGHVVSIDTAANDEARTNLARADAFQSGLVKRVELRQEEGGAYLARLADGSSLFPSCDFHMSALESPDTDDKINCRYDNQSNNFRYDVRQSHIHDHYLF